MGAPRRAAEIDALQRMAELQRTKMEWKVTLRSDASTAREMCSMFLQFNAMSPRTLRASLCEVLRSPSNCQARQTSHLLHQIHQLVFGDPKRVVSADR